MSVRTPGHEMVRLSDKTFVPDRFSVRFSFEDDHTVEMDVEVHDGHPECQTLQVDRGPGQAPLTGDELRRLPVAAWVQLATERVAHVVTAPGALTVPARPDDTTREDAARAVRRRQPLTTDRLEEVAYAYRQGDGPKGVARALHVSKAQAYRLVAAARERGILTEEDEA